MERIKEEPTLENHLSQIFVKANGQTTDHPITVHQFRQILIQLGYNLGDKPDEKFSSILSGLKLASSETFTFKEFKNLMINKFNFMQTRHEIEKAFGVFCHNSEGKLLYRDLFDILHLANPELSKKQIDNLLKDVTEEERANGILYSQFVGRLLNGTGDPIMKERKEITDF